MGAMQAVMLLAANRTYTELIKPAILMAPAAFIHLTAVPYTNAMDWTLFRHLPGSFIDRSGFISSKLNYIGRDVICKVPFINQFCDLGLSIAFGSNKQVLDTVSRYYC